MAVDLSTSAAIYFKRSTYHTHWSHILSK